MDSLLKSKRVTDTVTVQSENLNDINEVIRSYQQRGYVLITAWRSRSWWRPWVVTCYATLKLQRCLVVTIGPIINRPVPKPLQLVIRIGPISTKE